MADYITTTIRIGGTVTEEASEKLFEVLDEIGGYEAADGKPISMEGEFAGGYPDEVVDVCKELGLHLWFHHDAKYEANAAIHIYDPATAKMRKCASNGDFDALISATALATHKTVADALAHLAAFTADTPPFAVS